MVLDLLLIGLGIALEPFPLTAFVLVLVAQKGTWKGLAFILGWLACLVAVIAAVILATGNNPPRPQTAPSDAALAVKLAAGVVLILLAVQRGAGWAARVSRRPGWPGWTGCRCGPRPGWPRSCSPGRWSRPVPRRWPGPSSATAGSFLALIDLLPAGHLQLPVPGVVRDLRPARAGALLVRLRTWLESHQDQVIIAVCLLLGFWLAGNSIYLLLSYT